MAAGAAGVPKRGSRPLPRNQRRNSPGTTHSPWPPGGLAALLSRPNGRQQSRPSEEFSFSRMSPDYARLAAKANLHPGSSDRLDEHDEVLLPRPLARRAKSLRRSPTRWSREDWIAAGRKFARELRLALVPPSRRKRGRPAGSRSEQEACDTSALLYYGKSNTPAIEAWSLQEWRRAVIYLATDLDQIHQAGRFDRPGPGRPGKPAALGDEQVLRRGVRKTVLQARSFVAAFAAEKKSLQLGRGERVSDLEVLRVRLERLGYDRKATPEQARRDQIALIKLRKRLGRTSARIRTNKKKGSKVAT